MSRSANAIAQDLIRKLHDGNGQFLTIPWRDFYRICGRERFKDAFLDDLRNQFKARTYIISFGQNVIAICPDTNFAESA